METDSNISPNIATPAIETSPLTEGRKEGLFLPEAEVQAQPSGVLSDASITLDGTIPKALKEAYNNSFVSLEKPEILNKVSQKHLLGHAEVVKNTAEQILKYADEKAQVTAASQMLATEEEFLKKAQQQYQLYLAPGAIHQEQTDQNVPTIVSAQAENHFDQQKFQNAFTTVKNIAMKALVFG